MGKTLGLLKLRLARKLQSLICIHMYLYELGMIQLYKSENFPKTQKVTFTFIRKARAMPVYHLDWRLKLFCMLWLAILIILTVLSIFWTRKKCMQRRQPKSYGASELLKTCNLGTIHILQGRHVDFKPGKAATVYNS